jgi:hypothetical protein
MMRRFKLSTAVWLVILFLAAMAVTITAFYSLIIPEYRGPTFYTVVVGCGVAELIFFAFLGCVLLSAGAVTQAGHAIQLRIMTLVSIWAVAIIISGSIALAPKMADTFYADKLLIFQLIFTFFVLLAAYLLHRQNTVVEESQSATQRQRIQFQSYAVGINPLLENLRLLAEKWPDAAADFDKLIRRLDTLKTQLMAITPMAHRDEARLAQPVTAEEIEQSLKELHRRIGILAQVSQAELATQVGKVREQVDGAIAALKHREEFLSF